MVLRFPKKEMTMKKSNQNLLKALEEYGYPLFGPETKMDPNLVLSELVERKDPRLLEGFPVVLAHILAKPDTLFDLGEATKNLKNILDRKLLRALYRLSCELFKLYGLEFPKLKYKDMAYDAKLADNLLRGVPLHLENETMDSKRLKQTFLRYVVERKEQLRNRVEEDSKLKEEFRKEYLLSLLLTPRQKELVDKKLKLQPFTKTEREYFSRVVKKKLRALADPDLHRLAQKTLSM
ncbi:MAG: hypothetical protein HYY63_02275 [Elusimicrobia bacterium]|nr:hypothetical protein [Elusimicrobiota bacterium]